MSKKKDLRSWKRPEDLPVLPEYEDEWIWQDFLDQFKNAFRNKADLPWIGLAGMLLLYFLYMSVWGYQWGYV